MAPDSHGFTDDVEPMNRISLVRWAQKGIIMAKYDVLKEASALVADKLELLLMLADDKKLLMDERSRVVCRCPACRYENERALAWLASFEGEPVSMRDVESSRNRAEAPVKRAR
jgi:hypothetical protein